MASLNDKSVGHLVQRVFALVLARVCAGGTYRAVARKLRPAFDMHEATDAEMAFVQSSSNPAGERHPYVPNPLVTNWVAARGQAVIGFVQLVRHPKDDSAFVGHWLFSLHVWPPYRGMGIGEKLCQRVIARAAEEGATELYLLVYHDNVSAIHLYRKLGFESTTIPAIEELLKEERATGRYRVAMHKCLPPHFGV